MGKTLLVLTIFLLSAALPLCAPPTQQESLGDLARQLRAQHDKETKKATKVFTNDDLPAPAPGQAAASQPTPGVHPSTPDEAASKPATSLSPEETGRKPPESPEDKIKTRDYWQEKFKAARQDVAMAKEHQQLAEDELNLLQIQQVRELDPGAKADLTAKVQAKQSEVDADKTATDAAQKVLDDLDREFKDSGAPEDWSQTG
jgi:hypothetical protein